MFSITFNLSTRLQRRLRPDLVYNRTVKKTFQKLLALPLITAAYLLLATPVSAQTQVWSGVCVGTADTPTEDVATIQGLQCLIGNVLLIVVSLIGFAGFVMLVVGSFRYLLSGGNSKGTETAQKTMTFAVVGLVVALSSFIILNLLAAFTGVSIIKNFRIPDSNSEFGF
jgi:hypothetical protein